jgi:hypothetical protein
VVSPETSPSAPDPRLEDRVVELLHEHPGAIAFNGLRRTLHAHPESLTRALRRLERYGVVEHASSGYRLTGPPDGTEGPPASPATPEARWSPVAEVALAPTLQAPSLLGLLAGRWAGNLRWVGIYERPHDPLLVWSRRDGPGEVLLSVQNGRLRVYTQDRGDGAASLEGLNAAARELLAFALERIRFATTDHAASGVTTFEAVPSPRVREPN